jgi:hypothetical protein
MTPFECVGFPFLKDEDFDTLVPATIERMMPEARRLPCPAGAEGWSYRDPSGAGILAYVGREDGEEHRRLQCLKPVFYGGTRQRVLAGRLVEAEDCPFCDVARTIVLDGAGREAYPLVVRFSDPEFRRFSWKEGRKGRLQSTIFATEIGEGACDLKEDGFLPTGASADPPQPVAALAGKVVLSHRRTNALGGGKFVWLQVAAGPAEYDVVVPVALLPEAPAPGTPIRASGKIYARWFKDPDTTTGPL